MPQIITTRNRPDTGEHKVWKDARDTARLTNKSNGRGYRAVKAKDGRYAVIFRPAVANNRQRRVREV
jgi:hypothetical protein